MGRLAARRAPVSCLDDGLDGLDISGRLAELPALPPVTLALRLARPVVGGS